MSNWALFLMLPRMRLMTTLTAASGIHFFRDFTRSTITCEAGEATRPRGRAGGRRWGPAAQGRAGDHTGTQRSALHRGLRPASAGRGGGAYLVQGGEGRVGAEGVHLGVRGGVHDGRDRPHGPAPEPQPRHFGGALQITVATRGSRMGTARQGDRLQGRAGMDGWRRLPKGLGAVTVGYECH